MSFKGKLKCVVSLKVSPWTQRKEIKSFIVYLTSTTYPPGCDENKRVIHKKAMKFGLKDY